MPVTQCGFQHCVKTLACTSAKACLNELWQLNLVVACAGATSTRPVQALCFLLCDLLISSSRDEHIILCLHSVLLRRVLGGIRRVKAGLQRVCCCVSVPAEGFGPFSMCAVQRQGQGEGLRSCCDGWECCCKQIYQRLPWSHREARAVQAGGNSRPWLQNHHHWDRPDGCGCWLRNHVSVSNGEALSRFILLLNSLRALRGCDDLCRLTWGLVLLVFHCQCTSIR